mgnify:CR=1 FL=1
MSEKAETLYQAELNGRRIRLLRSSKNGRIYLLLRDRKSKIFFSEDEIEDFAKIISEVEERLQVEKRETKEEREEAGVWERIGELEARIYNLEKLVNSLLKKLNTGEK